MIINCKEESSIAKINMYKNDMVDTARTAL
ncbi:MAG: Uncharacterised protein [Cryomorphaceae bacterium]|nr:MAG: Uncharacterised protein [Cryomorphaceae bacterium]